MELSTDEVLLAIDSVIRELSAKIARKIVELNGKAPAAVMLIGGGSILPNLSDYIAGNLELPKERVGVKGREGLKNIHGCEEFSGPFSVTPIGIAVNSLKGAHLSSYKVYIDENRSIY